MAGTNTRTVIILIKVIDAATASLKKIQKASAVTSMAMRKGFKLLGGAMRRMQGAFLGLFLSIMFFGMQMKRTFEAIVFSSLDFFQKLVEGTTESSQLISMLGAAWDMLKFSIGDAIAEFLLASGIGKLILDIVEAVIDWVDQNKSLAGGLIIVGAVIGTIMFFAGQLGLLFVGLMGVLVPIMGVFFGILSILSFFLAPIGVIIAIIIIISVVIAVILLALIAIGLGILAWITNVGNFRKHLTRVLNTIWNTIKSIFNNVKNIAKNIIGIVVSLLKGDFGKAFKYLSQIFKELLAIALKVTAAILDSVIQGLSWIVQIALDAIKFIARALIKIIFVPLDAIIAAARELGNIPGLEFLKGIELPSAIATGATDFLTDEMSKLIEGFSGGVSDTMNDLITTGIDKMLRTGTYAAGDTVFNIGEISLPNVREPEDFGGDLLDEAMKRNRQENAELTGVGTAGS